MSVRIATMSAFVMTAPWASNTIPRKAPVDASCPQARATIKIEIKIEATGKRKDRKTATRRILRSVGRNISRRQHIAIPSRTRLRNRRGFQKPYMFCISNFVFAGCDAGTGNMFSFVRVNAGYISCLRKAVLHPEPASLSAGDQRIDHLSESRIRTTSDSWWPRMIASCLPSYE